VLEWCQSSLEHVGVCWNGLGVEWSVTSSMEDYRNTYSCSNVLLLHSSVLYAFFLAKARFFYHKSHVVT